MVILVFVCFFTLTGCKSGVKVKDDLGDMLIQTTEERGIHLSRRNIKNNNGSYTLEAVVTPVDASNKKLIWTLDVAEEYDDLDSFLTEHNMYRLDQYVKLTVSEDTLSCVVKKLDVCPVQLKIVVTSQANSSVSATCTIDFYKTIDKIILNQFVYSVESRDFTPYLDYGIIDFSGIEFTLSDFLEVDAAISTFDSVAFYKGTVNPGELDVYTEVGLNPSFVSKLEQLGVEDYDENFVNIDFHSGYYSFGYLLSQFCDVNDDNVIQALKISENIFTIKFCFQSKLNGVEYELMDPVIEYIITGFDFSDVSVTSVELYESNIIL